MKVSVAIITYNHENYIRDALDGILMQKTNFDFNIIIGEDASGDNTKSILLEYIKKYPNKISCTFQEKNIGMMPNCIKTLNACNGEYIALCEGDDYWTDSSKLQKQVDFLEANPTYVGCFHNVLALNLKQPKIKPKPWRVYDKDTFELRDTFSKTALFHTCSLVFRRNALQTPKWLNKVKSGDMALFSIITNHGSLKLLEGNMSVYRKLETGVTSNEKIKEYHKNRILLWKLVDQHYLKMYSSKMHELTEFHRMKIKELKFNSIKKIFKAFKIK